MISRDGDVRRIEPKAMSVLLVLAEGDGATVTRGELLDAVWPNQEVSDDVITGCISTLRRALGDNPRKHRYIETVPKKGYRLVAPVRSNDLPSDTARRNISPAVTTGRRRLWAGLSAVAVVLAGWWIWQTESGGPLPEARERSIAVLPFDVISDRGELAHFASGLAEELIHQLAANPGLHVIARTSSARFADNTHSIREISEILGVRHVIEGSVRDTPSGMRITVQLIDAETDAHLWSRVFDASEDNLIEVQEQVSEAVSRLVYSAGPQPADFAGTRGGAASQSRHPVPEAAYRLFLLGEAHMRVGTGEAYVKASTYFSDAIRIAPSYALAWSRQAAANLLRYQYAGLDLDQATSLAERALDRALEIDPDQPEALATFGLMYTYMRQYREAEAYFERALEQQPNLRFALHNYGFALWSQSKFGAALVPLRKALKIDPLSGVTNFLVADSLAGMGNFEASMAQYRHCMEVQPEHHGCVVGLSTLQRLTGDYQGAAESLEAAAALAEENNYWQWLSSGLLALQVNQLELAETYLDSAAAAYPDNYVLLRGQLRLSLATGKLDAFLNRVDMLADGDEGERGLGLIGGLAYFHAGDCARSLALYEPHLNDIQSNLVSIWDAEAGFSHAVALAYCHGQAGNMEARESMIAPLHDSVDNLPGTPISAQRFLAASYYQLTGQHEMADHELDRLRDDEWSATPVIEANPVFR